MILNTVHIAAFISVILNGLAQGQRTFEVPTPTEYCTDLWWTGYPEGIVLSHPDDMATYQKNYDCDIHIDVGHPFQSINVTLERFEFQQPANDSSGSCPDHIQFFTDSAKLRPITPPLCGSLADIPEEHRFFVIEQESFVLHMVTDGESQASGFRFSYSAFTDYHGEDPDDIFVGDEGDDGGDGGGSAGRSLSDDNLLQWLMIGSIIALLQLHNNW